MDAAQGAGQLLEKPEIKMIYRLLRWISGIALHWFYREIRAVGLENIPATGPLLIAIERDQGQVSTVCVSGRY